MIIINENYMGIVAGRVLGPDCEGLNEKLRQQLTTCRNEDY